MEHAHHPHRPEKTLNSASGESLNRIAFVATLHCLLGCAIGEVLGLVIGNALGWSNGQTIAFAVVLAFISGFALTASFEQTPPHPDAVRVDSTMETVGWAAII